MRMMFPLLAVLTLNAYADFSDDHVPDRPDILAKLIASAQASGEPLASSTSESGAYYLQNAEYIGSCDASFGRVHVAQLFYIRSAAKGTKLPSRGQSYIVFFDAALQVRSHWYLDMPRSGFVFEGTKFLLGQKELFDFANPPKRPSVIVDGKSQTIPIWSR